MFAITGKILYVDSPVGGIINFNVTIRQEASSLMRDPYGMGWLFEIDVPAGNFELLEKATDATGYTGYLQRTDGARNPEGLKGGVSGMCKAVYSGISSQKLPKQIHM